MKLRKTGLLCFNVILFAFFHFKSNSQVNNSVATTDYSGELAKMINIPNSPESQAFTKYGEYNVNMMAGTPEISIPLYTIQGREINLPISLTYDASGIKVAQMASQVGLGWNLSLGGRISRITNGLPDDFLTGHYKTIHDEGVRSKILAYLNTNNFANHDAALEYMDFLYDISLNEVDTQPDLYAINVLGLNDIIVFDSNTNEMLPRALKNSRIKVEVTFENNNDTYNTKHIKEWIVTDDDGTKYYFSDAEVTRRTIDDIGPTNSGTFDISYNSSWVLKKIESANGKDVYEFNYSGDVFQIQEQFGHEAVTITNTIVSTQTQYNGGLTSAIAAPVSIKQKILTLFYIITIPFLSIPLGLGMIWK